MNIYWLIQLHPWKYITVILNIGKYNKLTNIQDGMLEIMFCFTVIYYDARTISFANFSYFLINCINQDDTGFVVLTTDSDNAVAKTSHSCFLFSQN